LSSTKIDEVINLYFSTSYQLYKKSFSPKRHFCLQNISSHFSVRLKHLWRFDAIWNKKLNFAFAGHFFYFPLLYIKMQQWHSYQ